MIIDKSDRAGVILIHGHGNKSEILMIHQTKSGLWGFPKGYREPEETPIRTARRELYEETGVKVEFMPFQIQVDAHVYFISYIDKKPKVTIDQDEIDAHMWLKYNTAVGGSLGMSNRTRKALVKMKRYIPMKIHVYVWANDNGVKKAVNKCRYLICKGEPPIEQLPYGRYILRWKLDIESKKMFVEISPKTPLKQLGEEWI